MVECDCDDWKAVMPAGKGLILYGRRIIYCPWCGKPMEYDTPLAKSLDYYIEVFRPPDKMIEQAMEDITLKEQLGW